MKLTDVRAAAAGVRELLGGGVAGAFVHLDGARGYLESTASVQFPDGFTVAFHTRPLSGSLGFVFDYNCRAADASAHVSLR